MKTNEAIKIFGSVNGIAKALGISVQAVYRWGVSVPRLRAYQIRDIVSAKNGTKRGLNEHTRLDY